MGYEFRYMTLRGVITTVGINANSIVMAKIYFDKKYDDCASIITIRRIPDFEKGSV